MPTHIYESDTIELIDGTTVYLTPLKLIYLREFMDIFEFVKTSENDDDAIYFLSACATVSMKQYYPSIKTVEELEENLDLPSIYKILDIAAGIKIDKSSKNSVKEQATDSGGSWEKFDLARLESEAFLLGIWKDYEELERSMSLPELITTLEMKREMAYEEKRFFAAIQGVDLDKQTEKADPWEEMKSRVFSGGRAGGSNDVLSLQGINAQKAGFGIGMGLDYEDLTKK